MRNLKKLKRIVVKIGTNTLTNEDGSLNAGIFDSIAGQIARLKNQGKQIILVSSGAIGAGQNSLGIKGKIRDIILRQACAAIGQDILMKSWRNSFSKHGVNVAQVLLTYGSFINRKVYLNLVNSIGKMLQLGVVPIINENDVIAIAEIDASFGDNDKMSALTASKIEADLLIILSDVKGLYSKNPKKFKNSRLIKEVHDITPEIEAMAGKASFRGLGGMKTKIEAAKICSNAGIIVIISDGRKKGVLNKLVEGEELGTIFLPKQKISRSRRWIEMAPPKGTIHIDGGAYKAIKDGKNLLPIGISGVDGTFDSKSVVNLSNENKIVAKIISGYSSSDLAKIKGKKSHEVEGILGFKSKKNVYERENFVFIEDS